MIVTLVPRNIALVLANHRERRCTQIDLVTASYLDRIYELVLATLESCRFQKHIREFDCDVWTLLVHYAVVAVEPDLEIVAETWLF